MSQHPINLLLRFLLELAALAADADWGLHQGSGIVSILLAIATPAVAATVWGVFRVPNDPGRAPVVVSGRGRLAIECVVFATATCALAGTRSSLMAGLFAAIVVAHYAWSYDRTAALLRNAPVPQPPRSLRRS